MVEGFDVRDNCLYTRVFTFSKEDFPRLVFVCTSHMGTREYYRKLRKIISGISYGLYEGIQCSEERPSTQIISNISSIQDYKAKYSGLVLQYGRLKYDESAWMISDISEEESAGTEAERQFSEAKRYSDQYERIDKVYRKYPKEVAEINRKGILCEMENYLFEPSLLPDTSAGDELIMVYRNKRLLADIERLVRSRAFEEIGIVYGAMHFSGIGPLLNERGYHLEKMDEVKVFGLNDPLEIEED